jgi:hypothetical protein
MPTLLDWTQSAQGDWTQSAPETRWKTLEESAAILKAIFPNYPRLDPRKPYDGKAPQPLCGSFREH